MCEIDTSITKGETNKFIEACLNMLHKVTQKQNSKLDAA
jgi:hypothetical protein